ncbi:MAG: MlaD family protein [Alphaproteobacteria bacterium]|nr:MlaD family protein [Rhodospirillales bacterium]MCW9045458.1 MlaD family protein [Alphaproteobacteria bacterium]
MGRSMVETVMGAVVLIVAVGFVTFAYEMAQVKAVEGYQLKTSFFKVGGLTKGADVRISGIKVGTVVEQILDSSTFDAVVTLSMRPDIKLPKDTVATIASDGMLGGKYIRLMPGKSKEFLSADGVIAKTKDYRSLEDQVGDIIFLATGGDEDGDK